MPDPRACRRPGRGSYRVNAIDEEARLTSTGIEAVLDARRIRRRIALALAAIAFLTMAGGRLLWWFKHPELFEDHGATEIAPAVVSQPLWVGLTYPEDGHSPTRVYLESVHVAVGSDTSAASLSEFLCEAPWQPVGGTAMGIGDSAMNSRLCLHPVPAHARWMTLGQGYRQYLVLEVVPSKPGILRLTRVDLTYKHGLQDGTQTIRTDLTINAHQ